VRDEMIDCEKDKMEERFRVVIQERRTIEWIMKETI
jgi:hypothetical protein